MISVKTRIDFVTNSSSSSYIIAYKQMPEIDKETLEKYPFLAKFNEMIKNLITSVSENYSYDESVDVIENIKDLEDYIFDQYGYGDLDTLDKLFAEDDWVKELYNELKGYLNKGYTVVLKDVSYYNDGVREMLWSLNDGENIIVKSFN